jgi:CSLREA domain-containing protein
MGGRTVRQFQMVTGRMGCSWSSFFWGALRSPRIVLRCIMAALAFACAVFPPGTAKAATFVVNSLEDRIDAAPGDGVCGDLLGLCTLRAAITEANASPANDVIRFAVSGTIVLLNTLPEVASAGTAGTLEIDGGGQVTVSGDDTVKILDLNSSANLTLRNIRLERGRASFGGAISSSGTLTIESSTFSGNWSAEEGGAIGARGGTVTIRNSTFSGNSADIMGGAIYSGGALIIENSTFSGNSARWGGGAIYSGGALTIENSTFSGNSARWGDGGAISSGGALTIENSSFFSNSALGDGGAIHSRATLQAVAVRALDNQAGADGGGLFVGGTADIRASTFARNRSSRGAGVFSSQERRLVFVNVTFSENAATAYGGGFYGAARVEIADIVFCTFYANTAGASGAAIFDGGGSTRVKNSLVIGSGATSNCSGEFLSRGRNYSTDESCPGFTVAAPDALRLGPLADNGGPTETHALLSGSVAIDSAPDCDSRGGVVDSDQRGAPRPWGPACDVGAYEAGAPVPPLGPIRTPTPAPMTPLGGATPRRKSLSGRTPTPAPMTPLGGRPFQLNPGPGVPAAAGAMGK